MRRSLTTALVAAFAAGALAPLAEAHQRPHHHTPDARPADDVLRRAGLTPAEASVGVVGHDQTCRHPSNAERALIQELHERDPLERAPRVLASVGRLGDPAGARGVSAFDIQYTLAPDVAADTDFVDALEQAAQIWEGLISDDVTLIMDVTFTSGAGFIAATSRFSANGTYAQIRDAVVNDAGAPEATYTAALPTSPLSFNYGFTTYIPGVSQPEDIISVSFAQAQALGFNDLSAGNDPDSAITFNTDFTFDNDPSDGLTPGAVDTVFVMVHELGHALGFVSGVDGVQFPTAWDLFRVPDESQPDDPDTLADFTTVARAMETGAPAQLDQLDQFPLIPGALPLSTGTAAGGDGRQASHWKDESLLGASVVIGVMDPTFNAATIDTLDPISDADLLAFSLMGWDIALPTPGGGCPADLDADSVVGVEDLAALLGAWGVNPGNPADFDGDGEIAAPDLSQLLGAWGPCP
jgi:hypothetical protein